MGELILLDNYRPRRESPRNAGEYMAMTADVRMLHQISSWAECIAEIAEHFEEPIHSDDRRDALQILAVIRKQPLELG